MNTAAAGHAPAEAKGERPGAYGIRHPSPLARRLLDRIKDDPAAYLSALMKRRVVGAR